jgi:hypothetical protein
MKRFLGIIIFLFLIIPSLSFSLDKPKWLIDFENFAKGRGDSDLVERARILGTDEALSLGKEWEEFMRFNAPDLVAKAKDKYPDIKPGIVINENNYMNFPSLKKLLPEGIYKRIPKGSYSQLGDIIIVPTVRYYQYKAMIEATRDNEGKAGIGEKNSLVNWISGCPFPHSRNPVEIFYNFDRLSIFGDNLNISNKYTMYNRKGKVERIEKGDVYWMRFKGRLTLSPKPDIPGYGDIFEKGSIFMRYPYDLKGFSAVRTRFTDPNKPDEFISYIPALRRIRRLSGTDTQDPIIGTDISWDDWLGTWQKMEVWAPDPERFKVTDTEALLPMKMPNTKVRTDDKGRLVGYFEIRPVWLLEITFKKGYQYSKRKIWIDKEVFTLTHIDCYDARGNLWRVLTAYQIIPSNGLMTWVSAPVVDMVNRHYTFMRPNIIVNDPSVTKDWFDIKFLIKRAH